MPKTLHLFSSALLLMLCAALPASAKDNKLGRAKKYNTTKNTISLCDVYNTGQYQFNVATPNSSGTGRHNDFGIAYRRDMYILPNDYYLSAGLRLLSTTSELIVRTKLGGFDQYGSKFTFVPRYTQLTVPIYIGKSIPMQLYPKANLDVFAGGSVGVNKITEYSVGRTWYNDISAGNHDRLGVYYQDFNADVSKIGLSATLDAGFQFTPFGTPKLSLGCAVSYNLLQSVSYRDNGGFGNATQSTTDYFKVDFSRRFVNVLFSVNYSFGGKR